MAYFKVLLSKHFPGETEEHHENPTVETFTSQIEVSSTVAA